jgi:hypothetical protein
MKKKKGKGNPRRQPKKKKANASPWHKYKTIPPMIAAPPRDEIVLGDEIEIGGLEGPDETPEGIEDLEPPEESE